MVLGPPGSVSGRSMGVEQVTGLPREAGERGCTAVHLPLGASHCTHNRALAVAAASAVCKCNTLIRTCALQMPLLTWLSGATSSSPTTCPSGAVKLRNCGATMNQSREVFGARRREVEELRSKQQCTVQESG